MYGAGIADAPRRYGRCRVPGGARGSPPANDRFRTQPGLPVSCGTTRFASDLIWKRTVASQMADARGSTATIKVGATSTPRLPARSGCRPVARSSPSAASSPPAEEAATSNRRPAKKDVAAEAAPAKLSRASELTVLRTGLQGPETSHRRALPGNPGQAMEKIGRPSTYASTGHDPGTMTICRRAAEDPRAVVATFTVTDCSRNTSPSSSTTTSAWRARQRSPAAAENRVGGCAATTSAARRPQRRGAEGGWSGTSAGIDARGISTVRDRRRRWSSPRRPTGPYVGEVVPPGVDPSTR